MAAPTITQPVTGNPVGTGANDSIPGALQRLYANDASIAASIAALTAQVGLLQASIYYPPAGSLQVPAAGAAQQYGSGASAWAAATYAGRAAVQVPPYSNSATMTRGDYWGTTADYTFSHDGNNYPNFKRWNRDPNTGVLTLAASMQLGNNPLQFLGACVISDSVIRIWTLSVNFSIIYSFLVTWNGSTLSNVGAGQTIGSATHPLAVPSNNRRQMLAGTASVVAFGSTTSAPFFGGGGLLDRTSGNTGFHAPAHANQGAATLSHDNLGGGYSIRVGPTLFSTDSTPRLTAWLELWDDQGCTRLDKLRITAKSCSTVVSCVALGSTAVVVQWLDTNSVRCSAVLGVNLTTGKLSLYGPFLDGGTATNLSQPWAFPALFDATRAYFLRRDTATAGLCRLMKSVFNTANVGNELTSAIADDVQLTLGASGTAIPGLTSTTIIDAWQPAPNILSVLFYAAATTNGYYVETFKLS